MTQTLTLTYRAGATHRTGRTGWLLGALLLAPFMSQADATIANVATPSIHADLGASGAALEQVIGGYLVAFAVLLIIGARLGQTHGYKRIFLIGMATFSLASLACALAPDALVLVGARVLQGAGAALMFPQALTGIQLSFEGAARRKAIGLYAIALSAGAVTGQILGGLLISADLAGTQWRGIFMINVPIGLVGLIVAARFLPADDVRTRRPLDLVGMAMLSASILLVVLPLTLGREEGWPVWTWVCLAASLPSLGAFVVAERRTGERGGLPLLHLHMLRERQVVFGLSTLMVATGSYYALLFTLAQYLQQGLERSALASGLTLVPWVAAFGVAGQVVRRLPARLAWAAPTAGCLLLALAYAAISVALFAGMRGEALLVVLLGLGGFGLGLQFSAVISRLTTIVPADHAPDISGVSTTTTQIGGVLGVATLGTLYLEIAGAGTGFSGAVHAFAITTAALAGVALVAAILSAGATYESRRSAQSLTDLYE